MSIGRRRQKQLVTQVVHHFDHVSGAYTKQLMPRETRKQKKTKAGYTDCTVDQSSYLDDVVADGVSVGPRHDQQQPHRRYVVPVKKHREVEQAQVLRALHRVPH